MTCRPSIDENNPSSRYLPTMPSASTLTANHLDTGHTTDSDALARAQSNFSSHSRTPLNEAAAPAFPGVDENGRIRATDYATPHHSGTNTPDRSATAHHVHYPPSVDPGQYYTTVPLDGQEESGYNMHMNEKNGTAGSGLSAKKRGVLFGGAKRWSQGAQKDVELGTFRRIPPRSRLILYLVHSRRKTPTLSTGLLGYASRTRFSAVIHHWLGRQHASRREKWECDPESRVGGIRLQYRKF